MSYISKNIEDIEAAYLNEVDICLLNAVFSKKDWPTVQKELLILVDHMNIYEATHEPESRSRVIS